MVLSRPFCIISRCLSRMLYFAWPSLFGYAFVCNCDNVLLARCSHGNTTREIRRTGPGWQKVGALIFPARSGLEAVALCNPDSVQR